MKLRRPTSSLQSRVAPLFDVASWVTAVSLATYLRYNVFAVVAFNRSTWLLALLLVVVAQLTFGWILVYRHLWRVGSLEEVVTVAGTVAATGGVLVVGSLVRLRGGVSLGDAVAATLFAFVFTFAGRVAYRLRGGTRHSAFNGTSAPRALIFGAGDAGSQLIEALNDLESPPYHVVAALDDSARKRNLRIRNVSVVGGREEMAAAARRFNASVLLIAIANISSSTVRELSDVASAANLQVKIVPSYTEIAFGVLHPEDLREVSVEDLMGRQQIDTDLTGIRAFFEGKRVLVTGAGGSIGSELCRQLAQQDPSLLVMLDRDESGLHETLMSIQGRALFEDRSMVVCDIRDAKSLDAVFDEHRPEIVFHAAALKHLSLLEMWPREALQTNVWGTLNVLKSADRAGVSVLVNISTDKAADPISVLGYTKRIAERLTASFQNGKYLSVRFGNVLGSRGSFLPAFHKQIARGGPVTITHPDVTRFFMTISEAVQLTLQAAVLGRSQHVMILDMGSPVKILDVAQRLIEVSGRSIPVVFTGLRPGEKISETLFGSDETVVERVHPSISATLASQLIESDIRVLDESTSDSELISKFFSLAVLDSSRFPAQ